MFDRYEGGELAVLVHVFFSQEKDTENLSEFESLVTSAGVSPVQIVTGSRKAPNPKYFVGEGKAEEIAEAVKNSGADVVLFNHALSPAQERNLERLCQCRVVDRTGVILDIFAQRARTHEGKLQVELAQLRHLSTRLVRGWTHLERQKGGIGLRGPGETQLETDRRLLRDKIKQILGRLGKVEKQREQGRQARNKADIPTVSLVGYTNAGKSSLFNRITSAEVYTADQLFATLDPTLRRIDVNDVGTVVLADTVGFIRHLPHDLVAAFKATLQETRQARLLLHVVDAADSRLDENIVAVDSVLEEIEANEIPSLLVMNKIDMLEDFVPRIDRDEENRPIRVWLSAQTGAGIPLLFQVLTECLSGEIAHYELHLPPEAGRLRSRFYQLQAIEREWIEDGGQIGIEVRMPMVDWRRLCKQELNLLDYVV
ncbi:putative GTPase subunit of protease with nucleoside triP hydrolase domain, together with HflC-HflK involved in stability of phage lambda cII repressor [Xenorhabdus bovienii str. Jollieti]|uniref:GTPase HflX n=1 Tax=Xenorhabdus bovienii (strain SS-2004) TaxID=406818 RepID=D3UYU4_XENBS|nr:ribosome rescue GTPase HflX [Xenorhabdus bovienii]CBJ79472.1 putative GTPase subunit of protease with nucleoside triP hydrolase domain, together with HflC-HflK involved in stability of phage lambda cII repressor [Xenorhabdus bovienii SS-2004]CDH27340.1 putative GTPase subunit of protease with nucleoside triP hydrolase domain, together with HflC-HflK involved in stability of phage lambda cII repressor [Xenorhabdus bovienii str. Jollieti]